MERNCPPGPYRVGLSRRLAAAAAALLLASLAGCLGMSNYQFGARTLFREGIETVCVPVFDSSSFRRELGEELTEAVIKEIERRSNFKVVSSPAAADTILTGSITGEQKHLLFQTLQGDPREMEVNLQVKVSWVDQHGSAVRVIPPVPVPGAAVDISAASSVVPEVGQSIATSHQRAIQRLAEQIVSLMEKPW